MLEKTTKIKNFIPIVKITRNLLTYDDKYNVIQIK